MIAQDRPAIDGGGVGHASRLLSFQEHRREVCTEYGASETALLEDG